MKPGRCFVFILFFLKAAFAQEELTIYTYDAFTGSDSFGEYLENAFQKKTGIKIRFVSFGTAGEALNQVLLEAKSPRADLVLGLDEVLFHKGKKKGLFEDWDVGILGDTDPLLPNKNETAFLPVDYGYLAFVYDQSRTQLPKNVTLKSLSGSLRKDQKVVLQDPRTSSLGIEFLIWTKIAAGKDFIQFWQSLSPYILTIAPGWTGAYELFLRRQADFVLSFTTSPAYHRIREGRKDIVPLIFDEGHFRQVEGMVLLKKGKPKKEALDFARFLLSKEAQEKLPLFQWMYPARKNTPLPKEFRELPVPKAISVNWEEVNHNRDQWIQDWALALARPAQKRK